MPGKVDGLAIAIPALTELVGPSEAEVAAELAELAETLTPTVALDRVTLKLVEHLLLDIPRMTPDQRIRALGHVAQIYKQGRENINVNGPAQFVFNGPTPQ